MGRSKARISWPAATPQTTNRIASRPTMRATGATDAADRTGESGRSGPSATIGANGSTGPNARTGRTGQVGRSGETEPGLDELTGRNGRNRGDMTGSEGADHASDASRVMTLNDDAAGQFRAECGQKSAQIGDHDDSQGQTCVNTPILGTLRLPVTDHLRRVAAPLRPAPNIRSTIDPVNDLERKDDLSEQFAVDHRGEALPGQSHRQRPVDQWS